MKINFEFNNLFTHFNKVDIKLTHINLNYNQI
jgi:hypothetical protein